jgi:HPt (histidine-containing phosphotransfer) domain-containing protein
VARVAMLTTEPAGAAAPTIDLDHLRRMTFGDSQLEQELLQLFDRQAEILIARMRAGDSAVVAALAHTLKGSARGIGAGLVAQAADAAERAAAATPAELSAALDRLAQAVAQARAQIAALLRAA